MYSLTREELVAIKGEDFVKEFDSLPYVEKESIVDFDYGVPDPDPKSKSYRGDDREYLYQDEGETYYHYNSDSYDALQKEIRAKKQEENNEITPLGW